MLWAIICVRSVIEHVYADINQICAVILYDNMQSQEPIRVRTE